jgi:hypothetical protein
MKTLLLAFVILLSLSLVSCGKNNDVNKPITLLGTWYLAQSGIDSNNNDIIEANEVQPWVADYRETTFKADMTYQHVSSNGLDTGTYTFSNTP